MKDVKHSPVPEGDGYKCYRCDLALPTDICLLAGGLDVVDVGGMHEMFLPSDQTFVGLICSHPSVESVKELSQAVRDGVKVEVPEEKPEQKPSTKTEFEKRVAAQQWNSFLQMREMTRPDGL